METLISPDKSSAILGETSSSDPQNSSQRVSSSFQTNESKPSSKKREIKPKTPLKEQTQNEVIQRLSGAKMPIGMISPKEILESMKSACKSSLKKKAQNDENENKENRPEITDHLAEINEKPENDEKVLIHQEQETQTLKEKVEKNEENEENEEKTKNNEKTKTPAKILEEKKTQELSTNKSVKSIGKVALFYHKCGICNKNMITGKEKTRLLSCTHRFHEECIAGKANRCFLCDGLEAYDSRPSEKSLKKTLIN